jgi:DNA-binding HxlR family transcriptional regulator
MGVTTEPISVLNANCASRRVLDLLSDKWTTLVLRALERGTQRFGVLKRRIEGISQKMLTQTLRRLETSGLINRSAQQIVPPVVEYSLTPLGQSLLPALDALVYWAEANFHAVEAAWRRSGLT